MKSSEAPANYKSEAEKIENRLRDGITRQVAKSQTVAVRMLPTANKKVI
jgi:uncharacterized protein (UPF0210 family)